ncbi:MAG: biopolymer transporter ExbD [Bacteroidetes bacterium GWE2_40_63]|jgi:biopolymer transport protein ExbD|nr:MAG: biopolymer transporter ExbD [Bacteroidetes bacterium GWA2_40_14]OFX59790.1 MAG: biopolymer transporter ExbD [Bacteroidetes bacterium GWC2_40_13]OFX75649.1 MAG: biopolymer transporter ExbD [Bacteroidetes bacterium GWD2_40_43]OFX95446.1 MAG: biopolymer transporter ExbD [Bacteroidetes bacterium GWE2_40_63]OFY20449.1 MAG: biopolymer transporter ExbD [Bacteroidetes bacterium GWF2_40_13]OFZ31922.1 MAG: biopolymer transporter ExbD [Bacteroidetes bacterium RIFOXYC2_FULL_40_12]
MALKRQIKISSEFSMSSMSDLVFLLLIFFMITSTLIAPNALKLLLPQSNNQTMATKPITTVSITKDLQYAVEGQYIDFSILESAIVNKVGPASGYPEPPTISLHVDKSVDMEHVVKVMNIAKDHQYRLILATAPLK